MASQPRFVSIILGLSMILNNQASSILNSNLHALATRMQRLGETFVVRDVMVNVGRIKFAASGDIERVEALVEKERYSVVPVSLDGKTFERVFSTNPAAGKRAIEPERPVSIADHIPDSTPLSEAFSLFDEREWYLTLRRNQVSGLVTYWAFNSHEFRVQLYTVLSSIEELSREILAAAGCGVSDDKGIDIPAAQLERAHERFSASKSAGGGNRFVDAMDFHHVDKALKRHEPWFNFMKSQGVSKTKMTEEYTFTDLRDEVMHGRTLFPTYARFRERRREIARMLEWADRLHDCKLA